MLERFRRRAEVDPRIKDAEVQATVDAYRDRRASIVSSKWMKIIGFTGAVLGGACLATAGVVAPLVSAPAALLAIGIVGAAGTVGLEVGGPLALFGALRGKLTESMRVKPV